MELETFKIPPKTHTHRLELHAESLEPLVKISSIHHILGQIMCVCPLNVGLSGLQSVAFQRPSCLVEHPVEVTDWHARKGARNKQALNKSQRTIANHSNRFTTSD